MHRLRRLNRRCACLGLLLLAGCLGPVKGLYPPSGPADTRIVFITSHGWHTGVVVNSREARPMLRALGGGYPRAKYLEFGWGDAAYYQAPKGTSGLALQAVLWPTPTVMHVASLSRTPRKEFPSADVIPIPISRKGFRRLVEFINASFAVGPDGRAEPLRAGLYGDSAFYPARGSYWLLNTCNTWAARALRRAGTPITPVYAATAGNLLYQAGKLRRRPFPHRQPTDRQ